MSTGDDEQNKFSLSYKSISVKRLEREIDRKKLKPYIKTK